MKRLRQLTRRNLDDPEADAVSRDHHEAITECQREITAGIGTVISGVTLIDNTPTPVAHGLGREPKFVSPSVVRGATAAGFITEVRNSAYDRRRVVVLQAKSYGATITLDLEVK